jgi:hypothetical protein
VFRCRPRLWRCWSRQAPANYDVVLARGREAVIVSMLSPYGATFLQAATTCGLDAPWNVQWVVTPTFSGREQSQAVPRVPTPEYLASAPSPVA